MSERFVTKLSDVRVDVDPYRRWVDSCVVANGCFDVLHPGHHSLLKVLDDVAYTHRLHPIVAINSDESIRRIKGPLHINESFVQRPIVPEEARAVNLTNHRYAFNVVIFDEDTPQRLMDLLKPKIVIKGYDYIGKPIVKYSNSDVIFVPLLDDWSTSSIIKRV